MSLWGAPFKNYFFILEVSPFASDEVIKGAYRALAHTYHPDKALQSKTKKSMVDINEAYEVLSDPIKKEGYWDIFLQEEIKNKASKINQYYFYKNWEESLRQREKEINAIYFTKDNSFSHRDAESVKQILYDFFHATGMELEAIVKELKVKEGSIQDLFLKKATKSPYLTMEMEKELLFWILQEKKEGYSSFISKGFKYKDLYLVLLAYIKHYHITYYFEKIFLVAKQLEIKGESNLIIAHAIWDLSWPQEQRKNLKEWAKKEWFTLSFWERRKKSKNYQQMYKKLKYSMR